MGWDMIDETAWQRNKGVSLTCCWSWDETWLMRLPGKEIKQCHSLPVGHGMRHDWWDCWQRNKAVSLTCCWSWDETWLMRLPGKEIKQWATHCLLVMGYKDMMGLPPSEAIMLSLTHCQPWWDCLVAREQMWCYSLSACGQQNYLAFNSRL